MSLSNASRPPAPPTLVASSPLVAPLCCAPLVVHTGWLWCCLLSCRRLSSACASASHCTAASHRAPLAPLVGLVFVSPLVTLLSPVRLHLRLSPHRHLLLRPSYASFPAGCRVTSHHAPASRQPASLPLIAPLVRLVLRHLLSRRHLRLSLHRRLSSHPSCASYPTGCCVTSRHATISCLPAPPPLSTPLPHTTPLSR